MATTPMPTPMNTGYLPGYQPETQQSANRHPADLRQAGKQNSSKGGVKGLDSSDSGEYRFVRTGSVVLNDYQGNSQRKGILESIRIPMGAFSVNVPIEMFVAASPFQHRQFIPLPRSAYLVQFHRTYARSNSGKLQRR